MLSEGVAFRAVPSLVMVMAIAVACGVPSTPAVNADASPTAALPSLATSPAPTIPATTAGSPILRIALTDVRSGERFTLGGFAGKTVIVQGMAVW